MPVASVFWPINAKSWLILWHRLLLVDASKSNFWSGQKLFSILQLWTRPNGSFNMKATYNNFKISNYFSYSKLDYFSEVSIFHTKNSLMVNPLFGMISYSSSTHLIKLDSSVTLESDIDPGYISLDISSILFTEISKRFYQHLCFLMIWESQYT